MTLDTSQSIMLSAMKLGPLGITACSHAFTGLIIFCMVDPFQIENSVHKPSAYIVRGWQMFMPVFFVVGGYFSSYTWIGRLLSGKTTESKENEMVLSLVRRLVRLIPSLALMVFFSATKLYSLYSDPRWLEIVGNERVNCRKNWWTSLLFISNAVNSKEAVSGVLE